MGKAVQRSLANPILDLLKMTPSLSSKTQYSLSLSLSLNFYVNIWPVVVSIDMGFSYFVFFDIIILCVCGTIHFVIYINIENFQYCRGFWRYKPLLQDQLLSL